ncbi:MAG: Gx transporter family protein [Eubacteriales bacterium]|nr:Gx transporter family protein [Eubacteriales bacterium]
MSTKRLTYLAMMTAISLSIFVIELQLPPLVPIPGVKMGLANIVTVYAMFVLGPSDTALILFSRILLGSFFSGRMTALVYSLFGGLLCYLTMLLLRKVMAKNQIWLCSCFCAISHSIGQMAAALLLTQVPAILVYLPLMIITSVIAGAFTGLCAQAMAIRMPISYRPKKTEK